MESERAIEKENVREAVKFFAIAALAIFLPFFHNQLITGPIINALFFVAVMLLGVYRAAAISLIPSVIALSVGLVPFPVFPIIPFIMAGNLIQIFSFNYLKKNYWLGAGVSSFLKFIFIYGSGTVIFELILKKDIAAAASIIYSWPQLLTAVLGAVIAYIVLKFLKFKAK